MNVQLTLVAAGLLATSAAVAQTTVTLYGIADGNVRFDHTAIGTLRSLGSGGEAASRWGLRGTEDLGNGIKAVLNVEQDLDLGDNSAPQGNITPTTPTSPNSSTGSRLFGRRAIVGLNVAGVGEVRLGREYTPFYQSWSASDPFGAGTVGRATNYAVGNAVRFDNSITYETPSLAGFQVKAMYRPGEATTNTVASGAVKNGGNGYSASLTYAAGPVYVGTGYLNTNSALDNNTTRSGTVSGTYDFKVAKVHALFFHTRNDTTTRQSAYSVGLTVPLQSFKVLGVIGRIDNRYDDNNSVLKNNDANFVGLGGMYLLSKRTDVYAVGAKFINNAGAANLIGDNSNTGLFNAANVPGGFNPWSFQLGLRHNF